MQDTVQPPEVTRSQIADPVVRRVEGPPPLPARADQPATERPAMASSRASAQRAAGQATSPRRAPRDVTIAELAWTVVDRRWTVIAVGAIVLALTAIYLLVTPPVFESSILIQLEARQRPIAAFTPDLTTLFQQDVPTEGEMRIMKSRALLEAVVTKLGLDVSVRPRTVPLLGAALARRYHGDAPAPARLGLTEFAWGGERIRTTRVSVSSALLRQPLVLTALGGGRYRVATEDGAVLLEGEVGKTAAGTDGKRAVELVVSELTARPGTQFTLVKHRTNDVVEALQGGLRISEQGRLTGLIEIALTGTDPDRLAAILDSISTNYVRMSVERTSAEATKTLGVLEAQLPVVKSNLEKAERALNAFYHKNGTVNLTLEGQGMLERLVDIDKAIAENELRSADLRRYTERHPDVPVLAEKLQLLKEQRAAMEARIRALPELELESTRLSRQVRVATELYMLLLNRREELRIVKSGWVGNARVVEEAVVPDRPVSPKPHLVLTLGALLALGAGIAAAMIRNAFDRGVRDTGDIEAATGLPVSATIPHSTAQRRLVRRGPGKTSLPLSAVEPGDPAVEDLRALRATVEFALPQARNNVVAISGVAPRSGKSFVSMNLAHLLAAAGGRVVLVDADLRRGGLHRHFGVEGQPGLAEVLGGAVEVDAALRSSGTSRLDLLPAGALPPNPAELLAGGRMQQLLAELGRRYDVVIVDTPPVLAVSDSALVGRHAGLNFLVLRAGEHSFGEVAYALNRLVQSGVAVAGVILNDIRPSPRRDGMAYGYRRYDLARQRHER